MCGEKTSCMLLDLTAAGSPPRVRGKGHYPFVNNIRHRITPACAGKRIFVFLEFMLNEDHPRVCGEKTKESLKK